MSCMPSIRDTSLHAISKASPRKTWGYCHALLETRNSHSYVQPSEILLSMWPCPKSFGSFENGMRIGRIIASAWKEPETYLSIDFLNATHTSALFLLAQFMNFLSIESNLIHQDLAHFIAREAKIPHGGCRTGMVEALGQNLEAHPVPGPLDESERFPQAVGPIVTMVQIDGPCPFLDQGVDGLDGEGFPCLAARK